MRNDWAEAALEFGVLAAIDWLVARRIGPGLPLQATCEPTCAEWVNVTGLLPGTLNINPLDHPWFAFQIFSLVALILIAVTRGRLGYPHLAHHP